MQRLENFANIMVLLSGAFSQTINRFFPCRVVQGGRLSGWFNNQKEDERKIDKSAGEQFIKFSFTALSATLRAPILELESSW